MFTFCKKLKPLKHVLIYLNNEHLGELHVKANQAREELLSTQKALLIAPNATLAATIQIQSEKLYKLLEAEESF